MPTYIQVLHSYRTSVVDEYADPLANQTMSGDLREPQDAASATGTYPIALVMHSYGNRRQTDRVTRFGICAYTEITCSSVTIATPMCVALNGLLMKTPRIARLRGEHGALACHCH